MPGANVDEASGEKKVIAETSPIATAFLHNAQFRGFNGSFSPSQPTKAASTIIFKLWRKTNYSRFSGRIGRNL